MNFPQILGEMEMEPFKEVMSDYNELLDRI
jgi:hypothetical protein